MNDKQNEIRNQGEALLSRKMHWTKVAMLVEQIWLRTWLPIIIVAIFFITTLFNVWELLNPWVHRFGLALFALAFLASFLPFFSIRWPSDKKALKRLDKNSELPHHPAEAFKDHLDPRLASRQTRTLWYNFKVRLVEKIKQLRISPPSPKTHQKDPYAVRMLVLLTVAIGLFLQGGQIGPLINKVFALPPLMNIKDLRIDAWVSPPAYTGAPPFLVADGGKAIDTKNVAEQKPHKTPEGALLTIRINGENAAYTTLESQHHNQKTQAENKDGQQAVIEPVKTNTDSPVKSKEYKIKLTKSDKISIAIDGIPLREWNFEVIEDQPPIIGLTDIPKAAASGSLNLKYRVADDYGVIAANAHIEDVSYGKDMPKEPLSEEMRPLGDPPSFPLNLPRSNIKAGKGETFKDLTSHPWAGLTTTLYLSAKDEAGNTSKSPTIRLKLPEYKFTKTMAKSINLVRKKLILRPHQSRQIAWDVDALTRIEKAFEKDKTLYLGLRLVERRLRLINKRAEKEEIANLLYELARRAEDGELLRAERELRAAEDALRDALRRGADASEIQKRIDDLRKALKKFMAAIAKDQRKQSSSNNQRSDEAKSLRQQDLERMLKNIEKLAKSGSKDLANKMLSQMQKMLENLRRGGPQEQRQQAQNNKELERLNDLMRRQQKLMDETFKQRRLNQQQSQQNPYNQQNQKQQQQMGQRGNQKDKQNQGQKGLSEQQQSLRDELNQLMTQLQSQRSSGLTPLEKAARAMSQAEEFLGQKQLGDALSQQGQVMDQLKQGMDQLSSQGQNQEGYGGARKTEGRDPLGRPEGERGMDTSDSTEIPTEVDIQRARQILRDLQDRVSDPNRPSLEIEYFERLLKRF